MWSVFRGFSGHTTVSCWFCHETTKLAPTADTHDWFCTQCKNYNTLDAAGNIVDTRAEMYREAPATTPRRIPGTNEIGDTADQVFCSTCQRSQELVCQILASYLPDEDDPEYARRVESADEYVQSLKRRYPVVCRSCQVRVDQRLQMQAQWMYRRELAGALARSESARIHGPRTLQPQPSLRRKPVVVTWIACAMVGLIGCPLASWIWYYTIIATETPRIAWRARVDMSVIGFALASLTYFSRLLNPLWLYVAYNPGMRVSGLPLYKRRIARLSILRLAAALLQTVSCNLGIWALIFLYDLALTILAIRSIHTRTGKRLKVRQDVSDTTRIQNEAKKSSHANNSKGGASLDPPLTPFKSMSFGPSESNRDQDDTFWGTSFADPVKESRSMWRKQQQQQQQRVDDGGSSGDETSTVNTEIVSGLDTLTFGSLSPARPAERAFSRKESTEAMDVDVLTTALMGSGSKRNITDQLLQRRGSSNGCAKAPSNVSGPRPFEAFKFQRDVPTGLESKLSAFSIDDNDDDDDGSYQGLFGSHAMDSRLLGTIPRVFALLFRIFVGFCVVYSWVGALKMPLWCAWPVRVSLVVALLSAAAKVWLSASVQAGTFLKKLWWAAIVGLLLASLVGVPILATLQDSTELDKHLPAVVVPGEYGFANDGDASSDPAPLEMNDQWQQGADWASSTLPVLLLRWPQTRTLISRKLWCTLDAQSRSCDSRPNASHHRSMRRQQLPLLARVDWSAEVAALLCIALV
ncbi:hypothetical protein IW140_004479 [Coemansia sp. RSA 1813]|nr:hypothetical protein EV178_004498 [Coemansia sp. RSA 1646]KAJ1769964.1 hypothetical protein LPJ74_003613 [Coemansia sp. RSA 1843]KAJ2087875.1 hypothetical protein IW138_004672 [Coemansia sp. RSA 986]KAJ2212768.1 hypothetical protein EV179_004421 [Coemansia sp. RSA 487]KAJ2567507.1 hypothetical protein IW140_004479 [Coemansia sp. RSA 1813]